MESEVDNYLRREDAQALLEQVEGCGVAVYLSAHGVEIESVEEWRLLQQRVG